MRETSDSVILERKAASLVLPIPFLFIQCGEKLGANSTVTL